MNYLKQIPSIPSEGYYQLPPPGYSNTPLQEEKEINLRDYWKVIRKRQWIDHRLLSHRFDYDSHWDIHNEAHFQGLHYHPDQ